jgi:hypothetical protein
MGIQLQQSWPLRRDPHSLLKLWPVFSPALRGWIRQIVVNAYNLNVPGRVRRSDRTSSERAPLF